MLNITPGTWRAKAQRKVKRGYGQRYDIFGEGFIAENVPGHDAYPIAAIPEFVALAEHVLAMADDAYLVGHPEWEEIVKDARAAMSKAEGE